MKKKQHPIFRYRRSKGNMKKRIFYQNTKIRLMNCLKLKMKRNIRKRIDKIN